MMHRIMQSNPFNISWLRSRTRIFIHVLLLAALFQALLPMLLQPQLTQDADGNTQVICTLQGLQIIDGDGEHAGTSAGDFCPACTLSHAGAAFIPATATATASHSRNLAYRLPHYQPADTSSPAYFSSHSRAPPIA